MSASPRRTLVTGASSGIGAECAKRFDARGDRLALTARSKKGLDRVAGELSGDPIVIPADVTDRTEVEAALERADRELGGLDLVVISAAAGAFGPFTEIDPDDFDRSWNVTFRGAVDTIRAALPRLEETSGTIVVVGSVAGRIPVPLLSPYVAAKHGLRGLVRTLRGELFAGGSSVRIRMVDPGPVDTPFWRHVSSFDDRLPPEIAGAYRAEDVAASVEQAALAGGDRTVGGMMQIARLVDSIAGPLSERVLGLGARIAMGRPREPTGDVAVHEPSGRGEVEGGLRSRPSVLVAAQGALSAVGRRL